MGLRALAGALPAIVTTRLRAGRNFCALVSPTQVASAGKRSLNSGLETDAPPALCPAFCRPSASSPREPVPLSCPTAAPG